MNKLKSLGLLLIAGTLLFSSCKDDEKTVTPTPAKSKTELLTAKNWTTTSMTVNPPIDFLGIKISDMYSLYEACDKDDYMKFNTDKTYKNDEGATKCDAADPQTESGIWEFTNGEANILMDKGTPDEVSWKIESLTATNATISYTEVDAGVTYTYRASYKSN